MKFWASKRWCKRW